MQFGYARKWVKPAKIGYVERLVELVRARPLAVAMMAGGAAMVLIALIWILVANPYT